MRNMIAGLVIAMALAGPAAGQEAVGTDRTGASRDRTSTIMAAVTGGSLGIGPEAGFRFSDHVGVRGSATFLNVGAEFESGDVTYDGDLNLKSFGAMLDIYPFGGSFRLSGGARINSNKVQARATPEGEVTLGENEYTAEQVGTLSGVADVKRFSPALTLGWGGGNNRGFVFGADIGVLFQGAPRLRLSASGPAASDPTFRRDLEIERRDLQDDIDRVKIYPILQLAIGYRF